MIPAPVTVATGVPYETVWLLAVIVRAFLFTV